MLPMTPKNGVSNTSPLNGAHSTANNSDTEEEEGAYREDPSSPLPPTTPSTPATGRPRRKRSRGRRRRKMALSAPLCQDTERTDLNTIHAETCDTLKSGTSTSLAAAFLATLQAKPDDDEYNLAPVNVPPQSHEFQDDKRSTAQNEPHTEDYEDSDENYIWKEEHVPDWLAKYWYQRYSLFSKFDEGTMLDEESWFSLTPEKMAEYHAKRLSCDTVVDGFCGAGGNSIQFAKTCKKVIAVDIDPIKLRCARNNARIYGVEDKIQFILGDFLKVAETLQADAVFVSPPWGGPEYLSSDVYDIPTMLPIDGTQLLQAARKISDNICLYMPRNVNQQQLIEYAGDAVCELEQEFLNGRPKALVAYYGQLVGKGDGEEIQIHEQP
ncbi:RNA methyltransferase [Spizellomyces punctatus DAOM BR117]|uniref:Trimethylguanosine synthase n=1 Tax=Spizellomyces punctatus (strain DAOM BR117) TaxID=645134 RepID=A0A0L0HEZ0_SPIPD|nr:RNA methyltransferase [Spizellomyces punctatus DAOM BR117]KNC99566.1 hypothetical protein SPPG_04955 [Spizellomyces punctatus DAOM BR117]|eukprot:XP_016607606.1 hypothetical protein SPPG_04955 [Spizellomyces punctatus DAOM BR117]